MTLAEMKNVLELTLLTEQSDLSREVRGAYCGDLLSWVMGRAPADGAWLTIMSNRNVAAVAAIADLSCVILCEGVEPDSDLLHRAQREQLPLFCTEKDTFSVAGRMYELLHP